MYLLWFTGYLIVICVGGWFNFTRLVVGDSVVLICWLLGVVFSGFVLCIWVWLGFLVCGLI